jgi:hypothetical protein
VRFFQSSAPCTSRNLRVRSALIRERTEPGSSFSSEGRRSLFGTRMNSGAITIQLTAPRWRLANAQVAFETEFHRDDLSLERRPFASSYRSEDLEYSLTDAAVPLAANRQFPRAAPIGRRQPDLGFAIQHCPGRLWSPGRAPIVRCHHAAQFHRLRILKANLARHGSVVAASHVLS